MNVKKCMKYDSKTTKLRLKYVLIYKFDFIIFRLKYDLFKNLL